MAEYINVEELVNAFIHNEIDKKGQTVGEVIDSLPTIDIVRCKDCKHRGKHKLYQEVLIDNWCEMHGKIASDPNYFCADATRKE